MAVLKELIFNGFYFGEGVLVFKELIFKVSTLGECVMVMIGLIFKSVYLRQVLVGVVVLKELIFNSFLFGRVWW